MKHQKTWSILSLGTVYSTKGASEALAESEQSVGAFLDRYLQCDWGDCSKEDWAMNDEAVEKGERTLAVYHTSKGAKLWVITEWDRSATTFLLPDDY
jgi:hypothetical protein